MTLHLTTHRARTSRRPLSTTVVAVLIVVASGCSSTARGTTAATPAASTEAATTTTTASAVASTSDTSVTSASASDTTPTAATSSAVYAPCSLITEADAGAALGADPGPGMETPEPWGGQCNFGDGAVILNVLSGPTYGGQAAYAKYLAGAQHGKAADTSGRSVFTEVGGIGHAAFVSGGGPIAASAFYVNQTTVTLTVALSDIALPTPIAQVTALAKAVAARVTH